MTGPFGSPDLETSEFGLRHMRGCATVLMDDRELARRFPSGDEQVVRAVYERYGRAVHTIAVSVLHDQSAAADVVQATFLNAWRAASRFTPDRDLGPWLYSIARRQAIDAYRRERRSEPTDPSELDIVEMPPSLEQAWEAWQVRLALDELPADERDVVRLSWYDGLAHPEIAERLGVPIGTVKSRSFRAHKRLASLLAHLRDANRTAPSGVSTGVSRQDDPDGSE
jgi:RNA polymerase sigma-70 factor (ECF subfamily)